MDLRHRAGLNLDGDSRGRNTLTCQFTVYQVKLNADGTPAKLDIDFEQHCEGGVPAVYGQILLNAVPHATLARQKYGAGGQR